MYVCTYVRMYVCTYVCMYVRTYVCMYVCMYVGTYVRTYIYTYVCMYACIRVFKRRTMTLVVHVARIWNRINVCKILVGKPEDGRRCWDRTPIPPSIARPQTSRHVLCEMSGRAVPNIIVANFRSLYSPIRNFTAWRAHAAGCRHRSWPDAPLLFTLRMAQKIMAGRELAY